MRRAFMMACAGALIGGTGVGNKALAQTPITAFSDIAGKWKGTPSDGGALVTLEIEASGKFTSESRFGKDFGTAKIEGGQAIFTMTNKPTRLQLSKKGEALVGSGAMGQQPFNITFTRQ